MCERKHNLQGESGKQLGLWSVLQHALHHVLRLKLGLGLALALALRLGAAA